MNETAVITAKPVASVRKTITVAATQARAFQVFTSGISSWWPLQSHHIGAVAAKSTVIEPRVGARVYEIGVDGSECNWGRVRVWDPPQRLVFAWEINAEWKHDVKVASEVEVRFIVEGPKQVRVELEHRKLECYGVRALEMRGQFDSPGGWAGILATYGKAAGTSE
jgi:uncharacterized protein YndB with AHSA1/START domain